MLTYDFNENGNDILYYDLNNAGTYFYKQFSFYFLKSNNWFFFGTKISLKYYFPFLDNTLDLIWLNPSVSILFGAIANEKNSIFIIKTGFFISFALPYIENNQVIFIKDKLFIADGPFITVGIKLTEKVNLIINLLYQADITNILTESTTSIFDTINLSFGLEYYL